MTAASVQTPHQKIYELYLKRRIQRIGVLKNVIKQWHQLQHSEWFFGTLVAWHSATEGHDFVPDHFLDLIADVVQEDESSLDVAVDRLAAANKRVHEAIEAMDMNRRGLGARRDAQPLAAKAPGGKYNYGQVSDIVRKVATNPKLGRQSAVDILDRDGGGVANVSKLKPENLDKVYEACRVLLVGEGLLPTPSIN